VETVFHEAAIPSVPRSIENPVATHLHGAHATLLLLDAARRAGVRRFIFAASSSAYGDVDAATPKAESLPLNPLSPYAATKAAGELYIKAFARCYAMDAVALRYFNVFGPRQDPHSPYSGVIARFCTAFRDGLPVRIFGDGEQSRDFTFVENVVRANLAAAEAPNRLNGCVINVGCGEQTTLNRMAALLVELSGKSQKVERVAARPGDVKHSRADMNAAKTLLGYEPRVRFAEGLAKTWAWYCQNENQVRQTPI
jgi:UDP-glucose 4-epimerase